MMTPASVPPPAMRNDVDLQAELMLSSMAVAVASDQYDPSPETRRALADLAAAVARADAERGRPSMRVGG